MDEYIKAHYNPMLERIAAMSNPDATMQAAIDEMKAEIDLFRRYSQHYGYTFYVLETGIRDGYI